MSGFVTAPIGNAALAPPGENAPTASYPASVWDSQDWAGATKQVLRAYDYQAAEYGTTDESGRQVFPPEQPVDAATLNQRYGIPDHLKFDNPLPDSVAATMAQAKHDELAREDAAARSDAGGLSRFGAGLAASAVDPLNVAAAFVPVVGEARMGGLLARAGLESGLGATLATRALTGAAGALTAQVPLTALRYGLSQQEQADYTASDAMADIMMGTLIGGGLHTAVGGVHDLIGSRFARSPAAAAVEDDPATREASIRAAVAQMTQDQPVNIAPVLDTTALRSAYADRLAARGDTAAGSYAAYTPQGMRVELRPEVVEAADLIASHDDTGAVNPDFPHAEGMQPRDRSSAASQAQITEMASRLEPERLGPSPEASTGAPIVNGDGVVESGNGRVLALRRVYGDPGLATQADAYRSYLAASGHDVDGMDAPVLIGRRVSDLSPEDAQSFVRGANERSTLGLSATEQARMDAARVGNAIDDYQTGALHGSANRGFVGAFMAQVPAEERGGMILGDGRLSIQGEARIRSALLAHAYGDALGPTLERVLNGDVEHMKGVAGALTDAAGMWSKLRVAAASGEIPAGLDITPAIGEAVQLLDRARSTGTPIVNLLAQGDMVGGPSQAAAGLLHMMFRDEAMRQPVARAKLAELLDHYVQQALEAKPGAGLFGDAETAPADIFRAIGKDDARTRAAASGLETAPEEISPQPRNSAAIANANRPKEISIERPAANDPEIAKLAPQQQATLRALYDAAAHAKPEFDAALSDVAEAAGGEVKLAKLKGTPRAVAKIASDYAGDASRIKDLLRATIQVDTPEQAAAALADIEKRMKVLDAGKRDWINGEPVGEDGYRDIKLNVDLGNGLVAEVQINLGEMLAAKKQAHGLYVERAEIERSSAGRERTPDEADRIASLNAQQKEIYAAAFERARTRATNGQNAASDIAVPLRRADAGSNGRGGSVSHATDDVTVPGADLNADGTSAASSPKETGISPSISKNSAIEEPLAPGGSDQSGEIKAGNTAELTSQIDALTRDFDQARAAGQLDPEVDAALADIKTQDDAAHSAIDAVDQAKSCLLGGLFG